MAATNGSFAKGPDSRRFGGGRSPTPRVLAPDGTKKTLAEIAREGTWDAVQVLRECVNDDGEQMSTRIRAAGYLLSLGWGDAPKALQVTAITDSTRVQADRARSASAPTPGPCDRPPARGREQKRRP